MRFARAFAQRLDDLADLFRPSSRDTEFGEFGRHVLAVRAWADLLVDIQNPSIHADVEGPSRRERLILIDDAIRGCDLLCRIAQQGIIDAE